MISSNSLRMFVFSVALSGCIMACMPLEAQELLKNAGLTSTNKMEELPIKDLRLPLERFEDGRIKTLLVASAAKIPPSGEMLASSVRVEFYKDDAVDGFIEAEDCRFNREQGIIRSASRVRIERSGLLITGTGFECNVKDQNVKILADIQVVFVRKGKEVPHVP